MEDLITDAQVDGREISDTGFESYFKKFFNRIGETHGREGLKDTPRRVVNSWKELFSGYNQNPETFLSRTFEANGYQHLVISKNIELYSTCEHHLLPFFGKAHVAYIPGKRVVGLSKLARTVDCFSKRLQIQERLTEEIADAIDKYLQPKGVGVVIEAKHFCMMSRGVGKQESSMTTSALRGAFKEDLKLREEFLRLLQ